MINYENHEGAWSLRPHQAPPRSAPMVLIVSDSSFKRAAKRDVFAVYCLA